MHGTYNIKNAREKLLTNITSVHWTRFASYKTLCNLLHIHQVITQNADSKITQRYCCLHKKNNCST